MSRRSRPVVDLSDEPPHHLTIIAACAAREERDRAFLRQQLQRMVAENNEILGNLAQYPIVLQSLPTRFSPIYVYDIEVAVEFTNPDDRRRKNGIWHVKEWKNMWVEGENGPTRKLDKIRLATQEFNRIMLGGGHQWQATWVSSSEIKSITVTNPTEFLTVSEEDHASVHAYRSRYVRTRSLDQ